MYASVASSKPTQLGNSSASARSSHYFDPYTRYKHLTLTREPDGTGTGGQYGLGRLVGRTYTTSTNQTLSDTVTRAITGDITSGTELGQPKLYSYDTAGRLVSATVAGNTFTYGYGNQDASCAGKAGVAGDLSLAGKDSNRTSQTVTNPSINGGAPVTTTYCYDQADRLVSSSNQNYTSATYDSHGNTTSLGIEGTTTIKTALTYDSSDRTQQITQTQTGQPTKTVLYTRDTQGRLKSRQFQLAGQTQSTQAYGYTASGDSPDFTKDANGNITEKYLTLPGDVMVTIRPNETDQTKKNTYSLPNIHGDIFATTNTNGILQTATQTGPFGEVLAAGTINIPGATNTNAPNNAVVNGGTFTYVGQHEKLSESAFTLAPIQMGARTYIPGLGRFLSVDPEPGGNDNAYAYANDPVNDFDLDGTKINFKKIATFASYAAILPGPVGMVASGVAAASYAAAGDKKAAALACAGIALSAVGAGATVTAYKASKIAKAAKAGKELSNMKPVGKITSNLAGRMYVGAGAKKAALNNGSTRLISRDGLRAYRTPAIKSNGSYISNFERRASNAVSKRKAWSFPNKYYNGHLNVKRGW